MHQFPATPSPTIASPATFTCAAPLEGWEPTAGKVAVVGGSIVGVPDPSFILVQRPYVGNLLFYGQDLAAAAVLTGFVYAGGGAECRIPDPTPYNGTDYARHNERPVYLRTTVDSDAPGVTGSIRYACGSHALAGGPLPGSAAASAPSVQIDDIRGRWTLTDIMGKNASLTVAADGSVSGSFYECPMSGALQVPIAGSVLLELQLSYEVPCSTPRGWSEGLTHLGFALAYPLPGGGRQLLIWATADNWTFFDYVLAIGRR